MKAVQGSIRVNGEDRVLEEATTIVRFLNDLGLDPRAVAVEHNGTLLKREAFASQSLESGDRIEIVRFVQGG